ncbi:hypothetical protein ACE8FZ_24690 [Peribacillus frigoritolerans]|uniref:hypothetical protein n=1 Tax=Peribacillus frigoritolerans TaxID=450367 RepID=UPI0035CF740E
MASLDKIMQGLEAGISKPTESKKLNAEAIKNYLEAIYSPIVFGPYSVTRNARIKDKTDTEPTNEPIS